MKIAAFSESLAHCLDRVHQHKVTIPRIYLHIPTCSLNSNAFYDQKNV